METDHALDSLFGRIFYGKPVSTFPENALIGFATDKSNYPAEFALHALRDGTTATLNVVVTR